MKCLNHYLEAIKNSENQNSDFESESDSEEEYENTIDLTMENEVLSPRSLRVINKYGHYKPDYSSDSENTLSSNCSTESPYNSEYNSENESEHTEIPLAYG
tara:strand:+ start:2354 stop:2656 length:303 start_codon:yes stop_codon:yes gene_type:complete